MRARVWRSSGAALATAWVVIAAALAALLALGWILWQGLGQPAIAITLMVLAVACIGYMWRFALHPSLRLSDQIVIGNPLRTHRFQPDEVLDIVPGENGLQFRTAEGVTEAWCVQKSTRALKQGRPTRADRIVEELLRALDRTSGQDPPADSPDTDHGTAAGRTDQLDREPTSTPRHQSSPQTLVPGLTTQQSAISASSPQSAPVHHPHLPPGPTPTVSASYPTSATSASPIPLTRGTGAGEGAPDSVEPPSSLATPTRADFDTPTRADFDTLTLRAVPAADRTPVDPVPEAPAPVAPSPADPTPVDVPAAPARARVAASVTDVVPEEEDELIIRRARADDVDLLTDLETQACAEPLGPLFGGRPFPTEQVRGRWQEALGRWQTKVRIAQLGDHPLGYVAYAGTTVLRLGVADSQVRRGFGRQLLDYALADIFRTSDQAELHVLSGNAVARRFYEALGWQDSGESSASEFPPHPEQRRMILARPRH